MAGWEVALGGLSPDLWALAQGSGWSSTRSLERGGLGRWGEHLLRCQSAESEHT